MKISKGAFEEGKAERGDWRNRRMVLQSERLREDCVLRGRNAPSREARLCND
jgi:hypothetical protein